ncbi:MAG: oxidase [Crocinitomicaceae bacterium]|nr:oxidase [Crocinitomicaceae bacterium]
MDKRTDIILNEDGTLKIVDGDFVIGESNNQHVKFIMKAQKGAIRENPSLGFGAIKRLKTITSSADLKRELRVELQRDGYNDAQVTLSPVDGTLNIIVE